MKKKLIAVSCIFLFFGTVCISAKTNSASDGIKQNIFVEPVKNLSEDFMRGADISSLYEIEKNGGKFCGLMCWL